MDTHNESAHPLMLLALWILGFVLELKDGFQWLLHQNIPPFIMDTIHAGSWFVLGLVSWLSYKYPKKK